MRRGEGDDELPLEYDPEKLSAYFSKRPMAVVTRVAQLAAVAGSWAGEEKALCAQTSNSRPFAGAQAAVYKALEHALSWPMQLMASRRRRGPSALRPEVRQ